MILLLKYLFRLAIRIYFRSIDVQGTENIPAKGPVLFAANHPSAFMDPVLVTLFAQRRVHYLARGESFRNPIANKIFTWLRMIPIYRATTTPSEMHKNAAVFKRCFEHLNQGKCILIFPEGVSLNQPRLQPLKTGAARIVLGAAAATNFEQEVQIVPIGLNYSSQHDFQGHLLVKFGKPLSSKDYAQKYQHSEQETVRDMTADLSESLQGLVRSVEHKELEELVPKVEQIYRAYLRSNSELDGSLAEQNLELSQGIIEGMSFFAERQPYRLSRLADRIDAYERALEEAAVNDAFFKEGSHVGSYFWTTVKLVFGFPLFVAGWLVNYPAYRISGALASKMVKDEQFTGSLKLTLGLFTFLILYAIQAWGISTLTTSWIGIVSLLLMYPLGVLTMAYVRVFIRYRDGLRFLRRLTSNQQAVNEINARRQRIIDELEAGRVEWQASVG